MHTRYSLIATVIVVVAVFLFAGALSAPRVAAESTQGATFIGSAACNDCHPDQYERFKKFSKKARSWHSVEVMRSNLTSEELATCFECHTTGYGEPGGFVSAEETPELAHVGCETCHGPGSVHAEFGDAADITLEPSMEDCLACHNEQRVEAFNFKPLIYSGAH
jgi:hypothetical protein